MKEYPKTYEDFYQGNKAVQKFYNLDLCTYGELGEEAFTKNYLALMRGFYEFIWLAAVRTVWLTFFFQRKGAPILGDINERQRQSLTRRSNFGDTAGICFALFPRLRLGMDRRGMIEGFTLRRIMTYVLDIFPKEVLLSHNPFEEPDFFKLPYRNITLDIMLPVYQMSERLELLKIAEDRGMKWERFMDYLLNYIHSYNEEHGKKIYMIVDRVPFPLYVRDARSVKVMKKKRAVTKGGAPLEEAEEDDEIQKL